MRRVFLFAAAVLMLLSACAPVPAIDTPAPTAAETAIPEPACVQREDMQSNDIPTEEQLLKNVETMGFSGSVLIAKGDEIIFAGGFGTADGEGSAANTANSVYAVGSVSKQFTAAAVLKLSSEGKLSLSDPLYNFIEDWPEDKVVTLDQLLHMESGLDRDFWCIAYRELGYTTMAQADAFQAAPHSRKSLIKLTAEDELQFTPGSEYMYSNINYWLLSVVVENVSGMSFQNYIQSAFFEPCNMSAACMDFPASIVPGHYAGVRTSENADLYEGCGTVCANVYDIYEWCKNLHNGNVLTPAAYRVMTTPHDSGYGCGVLINRDGTVWHNGQLNGYNSYVSYDPESGLYLIILSNSRTYEFRSQVCDFPAEQLASMLLRQLDIAKD